jgi:hypothetical protein
VACEAQNENVLLGLAWLCSLCDGGRMSGPLGGLAESSYRTIFLKELRMPRVGGGCVYALGRLPGSEAATEMARLKASGILKRGRKGGRGTG